MFLLYLPINDQLIVPEDMIAAGEFVYYIILYCYVLGDFFY